MKRRKGGGGGPEWRTGIPGNFLHMYRLENPMIVSRDSRDRICLSRQTEGPGITITAPFPSRPLKIILRILRSRPWTRYAMRSPSEHHHICISPPLYLLYPRLQVYTCWPAWLVKLASSPEPPSSVHHRQAIRVIQFNQSSSARVTVNSSAQAIFYPRQLRYPLSALGRGHRSCAPPSLLRPLLAYSGTPRFLVRSSFPLYPLYPLGPESHTSAVLFPPAPAVRPGFAGRDVSPPASPPPLPPHCPNSQRAAGPTTRRPGPR